MVSWGQCPYQFLTQLNRAVARHPPFWDDSLGHQICWISEIQIFIGNLPHQQTQFLVLVVQTLLEPNQSNLWTRCSWLGKD